jgi:hypothetical protein
VNDAANATTAATSSAVTSATANVRALLARGLTARETAFAADVTEDFVLALARTMPSGRLRPGFAASQRPADGRRALGRADGIGRWACRTCALGAFCSPAERPGLCGPRRVTP